MAFLLAAILSSVPPAPLPDLLLEGATVYVSAGAAPRKASILVAAGTIAFVGDAETARATSPGASRIDLANAFVFPGLADAHGHLEGLG
jgi:predicted amidohydrolase YtcJ